MTICNCRKCNKELLKGERQIAEKNDYAVCANCLYLELIRVRTIADYNKWLTKGTNKQN
jgi:hypothetical protein